MFIHLKYCSALRRWSGRASEQAQKYLIYIYMLHYILIYQQYWNNNAVASRKYDLWLHSNWMEYEIWLQASQKLFQHRAQSLHHRVRVQYEDNHEHSNVWRLREKVHFDSNVCRQCISHRRRTGHHWRFARDVYPGLKLMHDLHLGKFGRWHVPFWSEQAIEKNNRANCIAAKIRRK